MNDAMLLRRKLLQVANGKWDPGFPFVENSLMRYPEEKGSLAFKGTATVVTPILPIVDGENNITYYIASYTPSGETCGIAGSLSYHLYIDDEYASYYNVQKLNIRHSRPTGRTVVEGINGLVFPIFLFGAEESYAYINETGRVLFAGRNTPYYGKANIND